MTDAADALTDEFYRDKLVDWMIAHDIPTGGEAPGFDDCLEVVATYIKKLMREHEEEPDAT
jgi:hypothetical protein